MTPSEGMPGSNESSKERRGRTTGAGAGEQGRETKDKEGGM